MRALNNLSRKGQSLIETVVALAVVGIAFFMLLKIILKFVLFISVDDFLESFLLCSVHQYESNCQRVLVEKLKKIHLRVDSVHIEYLADRTVAHLRVKNRFNEEFKRSREYSNK